MKAVREIGRVVLARFPHGVDDDAAHEYVRSIERVRGTADRPLVFCIDTRGAQILPATVRDRLIRIMRTPRDDVARTAILVDAGDAIFELQMNRMLREAGDDVPRRCFYGVEDALFWLGEDLGEDEIEFARGFLAGGGAAADRTNHDGDRRS